jgi:hypothetical protein
LEEKQRKRKLLIRKIIQIVAVVVLIIGAQNYFGEDTRASKALNALVTKYNSACPAMISNDIRMDAVKSLPHNTFQYDFTLVRVQKESIDVEALKNNVEKEILNSSKTNTSLDAFRDNGSTVIYNYKDTAAKELFKITLTPAMY